VFIRIFLGFIVFCLISLGGYIAWLQKEVKIDRDVIESLDFVPTYDSNIKQAPFFYVYGFDAVANIDPSQLGKQSYDLDWRLYKENPDTKKTSQQFPEVEVQRINYEKLWSKEDKKLLVEVKKHLDSAESFDTDFWSENKSEIETLISHKKFLLNRYKQEISHQNYQSLIQTPTANPPYSLYYDIHTLFLINLYLKGSADGVLEYIHLKLNRLNENLNSVEKALVIAQVNQAIDVLNVLAHRQSKKTQLPQLNIEQLSFKKQAAYEMRNAYYIFKSLDELLKRGHNKPSGLTKLWGKIYTPFAFNFNQSMNQANSNYQPYIEVSKLSYLEFSVKINQIQLPQQRKWALSNNIGNILNQVGSSTYWVNELLRPRLLNNKIQVFNIIHSGKNIDQEISKKSQEGYVFLKNANQLCIENPFEKRQKLNERLQQDSCVEIYSNH
jgi:hypothetical protein